MLSSSQTRQVEPQRGSSPVRERVLRAARAIVAERGPEALTVSEVVHRAGVNRGTAYQYFRTREHLLQAVKEWFVTELNRMLSEEGPIGARTDSLSLWAPKLAHEHGDDVHALTRRFNLELKRLLLYGFLRPDGWPDLVQSLDDSESQDARAHQDDRQNPR